MPSAARRLAATASRRSRARKLAWLRDRIPAGSTVLLVGVSGGDLSSLDSLGSTNAVEAGLRDHTRATVVTYDPTTRRVLDCPTIRADGRRLPFRDASFDYVVSNAVIEHVGGPAGARSMIDESVRVARREVIHTTPYRWFPVETHTRVPVLHWLPRRLHGWAFAKVGKPHFQSPAYWLFSRRELRRLSSHPCQELRAVTSMTLVAVWMGQGTLRITSE